MAKIKFTLHEHNGSTSEINIPAPDDAASMWRRLTAAGFVIKADEVTDAAIRYSICKEQYSEHALGPNKYPDNINTLFTLIMSVGPHLLDEQQRRK